MFHTVPHSRVRNIFDLAVRHQCILYFMITIKKDNDHSLRLSMKYFENVIFCISSKIYTYMYTVYIYCIRILYIYTVQKAGYVQAFISVVIPSMGADVKMTGVVWTGRGQQLTAGESIKAVNGSEVLQVVLLGQDEDHSVVSVAATRVHLHMGQQQSPPLETLYTFSIGSLQATFLTCPLPKLTSLHTMQLFSKSVLDLHFMATSDMTCNKSDLLHKHTNKWQT